MPLPRTTCVCTHMQIETAVKDVKDHMYTANAAFRLEMLELQSGATRLGLLDENCDAGDRSHLVQHK